jgi:carbonic anhydrase
MTTKDRILLESKAWREEKLSLDENYFQRLNQMHHPKILWISSADSLASIREMTNTEPGDIIVYRNVGTQVRQDDAGIMAVLEEAVEVSSVSHIIVCGYSHCSGIRAVLQGKDTGPAVKEWLKNLRALYEANQSSLRGLPFEEQEKVLSELNIRQQVINLSKSAVIKKAWEKSDAPAIYGWYLDLASGTFQEVFSLERNHRLKQVSSLSENVQRIKITAS